MLYRDLLFYSFGVLVLLYVVTIYGNNTRFLCILITCLNTFSLSHSDFRDPGANAITRCVRTKSYTYDDSWYRNECHIFTK
jgi:hypothetical protein